jgi:hypothetical protein
MYDDTTISSNGVKCSSVYVQTAYWENPNKWVTHFKTGLKDKQLLCHNIANMGS